MRHYIGFWTEVCLSDNDVIGRAGRNGRKQLRFRDKCSAFGAATLCRKSEEPNFTCCFHDNTCRRARVLRGLYRGEILKRQTSGPGGSEENFFCRRIAQSVPGGRFPGVGDSMQAKVPCS